MTQIIKIHSHIAFVVIVSSALITVIIHGGVDINFSSCNHENTIIMTYSNENALIIMESNKQLVGENWIESK